MRRQRPSALLVDLDGVLRRWDRQVDADVEQRYDLPPGSILDTATTWDLLRPAITGEVTHAQWMARVVDALARRTGDAGRARAAVAERERYRGEVDPEVLALLREVRGAGTRVGLATNATDVLDADLAALGLTHEVDAVVNSSALGVRKPSREYFALACRAVGAAPARVLLLDDDDRAVSGARAAGLSAYRWTGPGDLRYLRAVLTG
jgi:putative hydrolase of the HAD superfamily